MQQRLKRAQADDDYNEAVAGVEHDDGGDHAIDFITGSKSFPWRKGSGSPTLLTLSPQPLNESRKVYVSVT